MGFNNTYENWIFPLFLEKLFFKTYFIVFRRVICQLKINCFGVGSVREKQFLQKIYSLNLTIACYYDVMEYEVLHML